jgi:hypothetical protein
MRLSRMREYIDGAPVKSHRGVAKQREAEGAPESGESRINAFLLLLPMSSPYFLACESYRQL